MKQFTKEQIINLNNQMHDSDPSTYETMQYLALIQAIADRIGKHDVASNARCLLSDLSAAMLDSVKQ